MEFNKPKIIKIGNEKYVNSIEFHDLSLRLRIKDYLRNVLYWFDCEYLFQDEDKFRKPIKNQDYMEFTACARKIKVGRPKKEWLINLELSKLIALNSNSTFKKQYVQWLLSLEKQKETGKLLTHKQFLAVIEMVKVFSYYEYRKLARQKNEENYINKAILLHPELKDYKSKLYAEFNIWRNEILGTDRKILEKRLLEYCIANYMRFPKKISQESVLIVLDKYEIIKNAVWDLLTSQDKQQEFINNVAKLAKEVAEQIKPELQRWNERNLFNDPIENNLIKSLKS